MPLCARWSSPRFPYLLCSARITNFSHAFPLPTRFAGLSKTALISLTRSSGNATNAPTTPTSGPPSSSSINCECCVRITCFPLITITLFLSLPFPNSAAIHRYWCRATSDVGCGSSEVQQYFALIRRVVVRGCTHRRWYLVAEPKKWVPIHLIYSLY